MSDACNGMEPASAQAGERDRIARLRIDGDTHDVPGDEGHAEHLSPPDRQGLACGEIGNGHVNASPSRFAQRTGRQQPAIPMAAAILHRDLNIAAQRVMLQAVVGDQDIDVRVGRQERPARLETLAPDEDRHPGPARDQERLVADFKKRTGEPWMTQDSISSYGDMWIFKDALEKCARERISGFSAGAFMLGRFISLPQLLSEHRINQLVRPRLDLVFRDTILSCQLLFQRFNFLTCLHNIRIRLPILS